MTNPYFGPQIDFSPLLGMGEDLAGGLSKRWQNKAMEGAIKSATGPDGTVDYSKAFDTLLRAGNRSGAMELSKMAEMTGYGTPERFGMQIYFDQDGNPYQPSNRGGLQPAQMPEGSRLRMPQTYLNTGTSHVQAPKLDVPGGSGPVPIDVAGEKFGQEMGARAAEAPVAKAKVDSAFANLDSIDFYANELLKRPDELRAISGNKEVMGIDTGVPSAWLPNVTQGARNATSALETVKAKIGFAALQAMREASQTGGALGQVAIQENIWLQNSVAALQAEQDPQRIVERVKEIQSWVARTKTRLQSAYDQTYSAPALRPGELPVYGSPQPDPGNESVYPEAGPQPSPEDMQKLQRYQADPAFRAAFEQKYGAGSVDRWLNNDGWTGR